MVTATAVSDSVPSERNWKCVPSGIVTQTPASTVTTLSWTPALRHISPCPPRKYQISSTVRCATAYDVSPGASSKWARLPPARRRSVRTCEPSGATASGSGAGRSVANGRSEEPAMGALVGEVEAERHELGVDVRLVRVADLGVADRLQPPADELRHVGRVRASEHVERGRVP